MHRRTLRGGELAEGGLQAVPWTYLEAMPAQDTADQAKLAALVHSANRQPFGVRRQGRVEQLAIAVRASRGLADPQGELADRERLVALLGYSPHLENCALCGRSVEGAVRFGVAVMQKLELWGAVRNLLDEDYESEAGFPGQGRTFAFGAAATF